MERNKEYDGFNKFIKPIKQEGFSMAIAELVMPKMGESITEATILHWHKKVGDSVNQDETVLDIATDKVDSEIPSDVAGTITELLFNVNDVVPVGSVLARIEVADLVGTSASAITPPPIPDEPHQVSVVETVQPAIIEVNQVPYIPQSAPTSRPSVGNNRFFSPLVLNIANSEGLSLSELERIPGTGADGRVSKKDIILYITDKKAGNTTPFIPLQQPAFPPSAVTVEEEKSQVTAEQPIQKQFRQTHYITNSEKYDPQEIKEQELMSLTPGENAKPSVEIIEMDRMRKLIAKHMVNSKHISAHVTSFAEADVTNMVTWRNRIKHDFEQKTGTKITFTPMFIECLVKAMKRFPIINSSVIGDTIAIKSDINIGMATALPNNNLIVPVIKHAELMGLVGLATSVNTLANNARHNKLKPEDIQDGTFTFTNVGTFGSLMGTPIINQPQVAILAVGIIKKRPVVIETDKGDFIGIRHMIYLSLSYDHRIIDGSVGSSFLSEVAKEFENWDVSRELKLVVKEQYVD